VSNAAPPTPSCWNKLEKNTLTAPEVSKKTASGKRGRPKGRKNQQRRDGALSPYRRFVQETIRRVLQMIGTSFTLVYFVLMGPLAIMMRYRWSDKPVYISLQNFVMILRCIFPILDRIQDVGNAESMAKS